MVECPGLKTIHKEYNINTPKQVTWNKGDICTYVPILGVGHPRTGTGYTSKILKKWNVDVGHEYIGKDGIVSWFLTFNASDYLWQHEFDGRPDYDHLIYNTRDPKTSLASIVYTETPHTVKSHFDDQKGVFVVKGKSIERHDFISHRWRRIRIPGMEQKNPIETAIISVCTFNKLINKLKPDVTYRIEDQPYKLFEYISQFYPQAEYEEQPEKYNTRKHAPYEEMIYDFGKPRDVYIDMINEYCVEHGYEEIYFK